MVDVKLMQGDCLEQLKNLQDNSADSIVTDPPYELGFMGKGWDKTGIANNVEMWKECLRVLKPGGHLLAFSGSRTYHRMTCAIEDAGFEVRDQIMWVYGSGFPKSHNLKDEWEGWGTALKPAHEPICVARKPLSEKTVANNVLKWGCGALNIGVSRVPIDLETDASQLRTMNRGKRDEDTNEQTWGLSKGHGDNPQVIRPEGRWPANLIHDGSAGVLECFPEAKGQQGAITGKEPSSKTKNTFGEYEGREPSEPRIELDKSASRFFYCAKSSKKDRGEGNSHPTVKPQELMKYLVKLVTPPNGTVLDPFMGSGSTGLAAKAIGFKFIGIEKDEGYFAIAKARIESVENASNTSQNSLETV
jgi:DNA modification methylase